MNAKEFVACWKREKDNLVNAFTDPQGDSAVAVKIASLGLGDDQVSLMKEIVDDILVDAFYTLLLGLDGEANIGGVQSCYTIQDEAGKVISKCGEIEAEAYEQFHGQSEGV